MAREAGFEQVDQDVDEWICFTGEIERLVAFVRADEREACAALADKLEWADNKGVASAIRARGT
jgi:hypothetical protein